VLLVLYVFSDLRWEVNILRTEVSIYNIVKPIIDKIRDNSIQYNVLIYTIFITQYLECTCIWSYWFDLTQSSHLILLPDQFIIFQSFLIRNFSIITFSSAKRGEEKTSFVKNNSPNHNSFKIYVSGEVIKQIDNLIKIRCQLYFFSSAIDRCLW
jgi:hypothetical protein